MIYVGTCSVGVFVSSMSPTVMSMCEQYIDINREYHCNSGGGGGGGGSAAAAAAAAAATAATAADIVCRSPTVMSMCEQYIDINREWSL